MSPLLKRRGPSYNIAYRRIFDEICGAVDEAQPGRENPVAIGRVRIGYGVKHGQLAIFVEVDARTAAAFRAKLLHRLQEWGLSDIRDQRFDVAEELLGVRLPAVTGSSQFDFLLLGPDWEEEINRLQQQFFSRFLACFATAHEYTNQWYVRGES